MGRWTDKGFIANNLQEYIDRYQTAFVNAFGDDFSVSASTPQGILIQWLAELMYNCDMDGIQGWAMLNPNTITGGMLDLIGGYRGLPRSQGAPQTAFADITVNTSNFQIFTIPSGTVFTTSDGGTTFITTKPQTISTPNASIEMEYTASGESGAIVGTGLTVQNFDQITNIVITNLNGGTPAETDLEYRQRLLSEYPVANNTIEWVQNKLLESPLVSAVGVNYNDTDTESGGIGAYCTEWMAVPAKGADQTAFEQEVGTIIINNKVPGSPTDGDTTVTVTDMFGAQKVVKFTQPDMIDLEITVQVSTPETTGMLNLSNVDTIRDTIEKYINGLTIGKDVSFSRIMAPLTADTGFDVTSVQIRALPDGAVVTNSNYSIGAREYAHIDLKNIIIGG